MEPLPKLCGADIELGNFILGAGRHASTGHDASRALLREIEGVADSYAGADYGARPIPYSYAGPYGAFGNGGDPRDGGGSTSRDWGRKWLPAAGGCVYVDLDHIELALPELRSAYDHVACWHAMLRTARKAMDEANRKLPRGRRLLVLVNNSDGFGNSYGSHLNFLVSRRAWENIFSRKLHHMLYLAAFQVSSIVFTGAGKVGSENGAPEVDYQIAQRADFFEQLAGPQTTFSRPLCNSRDEALCGPKRRLDSNPSPAERMARLHVIFFDNTLCQTACLLKVGVMQIVLAMLERERINPGLLLDDPLEAVRRWSHDPTLRARARTASGNELTAVELQLLFLEEAKRFLDSGEIGDSVPEAEAIVALWEDTLLKLEARDFSALARRLDWVLKLSLLERALSQRPDLGWRSAEAKHLDQIYASLDPSEGLYWACEKSGFPELVVPEERIEWFTRNPPEDTRAWTRAMLLRRVPRGAVASVDWDSMRIRLARTAGWSRYTELELADPLGFTKASSEAAFRERSLEDVLQRLAVDAASGRKEDIPQRRGLGFRNLLPS